MKRLALTALAAVVAAVLLGVLLERFQHPQALVAEEAPAPVHRATVDLTAAGMVPPKLRVPKDAEIHLLISAAPDAPEGILTVTGYEDVTEAVGIGPGLARELVFVSRRPGDDFAFMLAGEVVGRLEVTGSHLEAGHQ